MGQPLILLVFTHNNMQYCAYLIDDHGLEEKQVCIVERFPRSFIRGSTSLRTDRFSLMHAHKRKGLVYETKVPLYTVPPL